jgi:ATP-dependent RNA helicase SUPV3L1/SUV3
MDAALPAGFYEAVGFRPMGSLAVRLDMLERFAAEARHLSRSGPFAANPVLASHLNLAPPDIGKILEALGYRPQPGESSVLYRAAARRPASWRARDTSRDREASPFAALRHLTKA